jgi:hypothetical protein
MWLRVEFRKTSLTKLLAFMFMFNFIPHFVREPEDERLPGGGWPYKYRKDFVFVPVS